MTTQNLTKTMPEAIWLNVSPSFQWLSGRLLNRLAGQCAIAHWAYSQTPDESGSLEVAITLLHDYIKGLNRPVHLLGHGTSGLLGLLYARRFPRRVRSLGLLSVGANPAANWQAYYYTLLSLLPCSRDRVLGHMVRLLFGHRPWPEMKDWIGMLERDLLLSPSPHTPLKRVDLCPAGLDAPLFICGGSNDGILSPTQLQGWRSWLKEGDCLWQCPDGQHFFHADFPEIVAAEILNFWGMSEAPAVLTPIGLESAHQN